MDSSAINDSEEITMDRHFTDAGHYAYYYKIAMI